MTVIRPNSISGVSSITAQGGNINVHRADGTVGDLTINNIVGVAATFTGNLGVGGVLTYEDVTNVDSVGVITARDGIRCTGIVTATSFHGDGSSLTGVGASFGNSSINTSGIVTATAFVPTTGQLSHRNLIINGAMTIAQRSTSITQSSGYGSVDRIIFDYGGIAAHIPQAQVDVSSGTTPYTLGFRKAFKITNGNQGSSLPTAGYISIIYKIEAQDIATSGWNYKSASSYVTLSFWVKASVAQNYYFRFQTKDGTSYNYPMETGSLTANTWTKITKTIPGNSNLQIDNDNGEGPKIEWATAWGTDSTSSSVNLNQWAAYSDGTKTPDQTTTWYTTNSATFEITGVQLEVGPVATPFEHRTYQEEILRCMRYYQQLTGNDRGYNGATGGSGSFKNCVIGIYNGATDVRGIYYHMVPMRDEPSLTVLGALTDFDLEPFDRAPAAISMQRPGVFQSTLLIQDSGSATAGQACELTIDQAAGGLAFSAEL